MLSPSFDNHVHFSQILCFVVFRGQRFARAAKRALRPNGTLLVFVSYQKYSFWSAELTRVKFTVRPT